MLQVVVTGVTGVITGILTLLQARQVPETSVEHVRRRIRIKLEENAIDLAIDGCRLSRVDLVGYIVVVATWH